MASCASCNSFILFGGKKRGLVRFCNAKCETCNTLVDAFRLSPLGAGPSTSFKERLGGTFGLFKRELSISPAGIRWNDKHYSLDAINGIRCGIVRTTVNRAYRATDCTIAFGDEHGSSAIDLGNELTYSRIVHSLWHAVGGRLLVELAKGLREGRSFDFGDMTIEDGFVHLRRHNFLTSETLRVPISEVRIGSQDGRFCVAHATDKNVHGSASYIRHWNTHVLEHLMRKSFNGGSVGSLSACILDEA